MPQKKKKLSLEEFRSQLGISNGSPNPQQKQRKPNFQQSKKRKNPRKPSGLPKAQIEKRISQLERKMMEGDLNEAEEKKVLAEIDRLEKQK